MTAWSYQQARRSPAADRTSEEGYLFASKAELRRWEELKLLKRAGEIDALSRQVKFPLAFEGRPVKIRSKGFPNGRPCVYTVDFVYITASGDRVYEEFKGHDNEAGRLRRAVVEALYNIEIVVTGPAASKTPRAA